MKTMEQMQAEYDDLMEHYRASLKQKNYEEAEYFFNEAQKAGKEDEE